VVLLVCAFRGESAAEVCYAYDRLNRLAGVVDETGRTALYDYDAVGNILAIRRADAAGSFAITFFTPGVALVGEVVQLIGIGFGSVVADNVVRFNGVAATVLVASSCHLTVVVPDTTTGSLSVTAGGRTTLADSDFIIVAPPVIDGIAPAFAVAGTTVTGLRVQGSHLTGATFSFPAGGNNVAVTRTSIDGDGAGATLDVQAVGVGSFVLVATTPFGSSSPIASQSNVLVVLPVDPSKRIGEAVTGLFSVLNESPPPVAPVTQEAVGRTFSVLNTTDPPLASFEQEAVSPAFSLSNQAP
jgi:YD repeat-containing protein